MATRSPAQPFAAQAQAGNVKVVRGPWNNDSSRSYTGSDLTHDDQVDGGSGAYEMLSDFGKKRRRGAIVSDEGKMLTINSALLARAVLAAQLGMQFGGERDVYRAAGYDRNISLEKYLAAYRRGLGKRLVNLG